MKKTLKIRLAAIAAGSISAVPAFAALPAVVGTTITGIQTDGLALIDLFWPVVAAITGGFILFKLFKRGSAKI